jgi:hypothetical protein
MIFRLPQNFSHSVRFVLGHFLAKKENRSFCPDRIPPNLPSKDGIFHSRDQFLCRWIFNSPRRTSALPDRGSDSPASSMGNLTFLTRRDFHPSDGG